MTSLESIFILVVPNIYAPENAPHVVDAIKGLDDLSAAVTITLAAKRADAEARLDRN